MKFNNLQEVFDAILSGLNKQDRVRSFIPEKSRCVYRGPNGTKCAVGLLIPDESYDPEFEGFGVQGLSLKPEFKAAMLVVGIDLRNLEVLEFLNKMQHFHDSYMGGFSYETQVYELRKLAKEHNLTFDANIQWPPA